VEAAEISDYASKVMVGKQHRNLPHKSSESLRKQYWFVEIVGSENFLGP
jgi:hypothetical protein